MTTKHTPGPWSISEYDDGSIVGKNEGTVGRPIICSMSAWFRGRELGKHATQDLMRANARLIAAAPDLLEACKYAESELGPNSPSDGDKCWDALEKLRSAIAKAEGE